MAESSTGPTENECPDGAPRCEVGLPRNSTVSHLSDPAPIPVVGPTEFIRALYGDAFTPDRRCVLWSKGCGITWCASPDEVGAVAARIDATHDVYFGTCLQRADAEGPEVRGSADTTVVLPGVWIDVDVLGPKKSKPYPPSLDEALAHLASRIELHPSIILHTGGGVHLWWLFDEPLEFENDADRQQGDELLQRWKALVHGVFAERNWAVDSTFDLARVMRMPGTHNHKHSPPLPALLTKWDVTR